jgi:hypothetical protein
METKLKVECIEKPTKKRWVCIDISVGNIYEVKRVDTDDFEIIDDKKLLLWYHKDLFKIVNR